MKGLRINTKTKEGRKTAPVATNAPVAPAMTKPTKVAVLNTGPGVLHEQKAERRLTD
jgi:hypothetical protein